jgi:[ribosomal protein S5]-alanine N-acetyltransferase
MKKVIFLAGLFGLSNLMVQAAPSDQTQYNTQKQRVADIFSKPIQLETERLILRKVKDSDIEDIFEYAKNPLVTSLTGWVEHKDKKDSRRFIDKIRRGYESNEYLYLVVEDKELNKVVGSAAVIHISPEKTSSELSLSLAESHWGSGYGSEIMRRMIQFGFEVMGFDFLAGYVFPEHIGSNKMVKRVGMQFLNQRLYPWLIRDVHPVLNYYEIQPK